MLPGEHTHTAIEAFGGHHGRSGSSTLRHENYFLTNLFGCGCDQLFDPGIKRISHVFILEPIVDYFAAHVGEFPRHLGEGFVEQSVKQFTFLFGEVAYAGLYRHVHLLCFLLETPWVNIALLAASVFGSVLNGEVGDKGGCSGNSVAKALRLGFACMGIFAHEAHIEAACGEVAVRDLVAPFAVKVEKNVGRKNRGVYGISSSAHILVGAERELQSAMLNGFITQNSAYELHGYGAAAFVIGAEQRCAVGADYRMTAAIVRYGNDFAARGFGRNVKVAAYAHCRTSGSDIGRYCNVEIIGIGEFNLDSGRL